MGAAGSVPQAARDGSRSHRSPRQPCARRHLRLPALPEVRRLLVPAHRPAVSDTDVLLTTDRPGLLHRGKVRDLYDLPDGRMLMVATDRMSAFDVVMPNGIPRK